MGDETQISQADFNKLFKRWYNEPDYFAQTVFGVKLWDRQIEMMRAVRDHKLVTVKAAQKVSKSFTAAIIAYWWATTRKNALVLITASTALQVREVIWRELRRWHGLKRVDFGSECNSMPANGCVFPNGNKIIGLSPTEPERAAGFSSHNLLVICDEASALDQEIFEAYSGNLSSGGHMFMISNPTRLSGPFYDSWHRSNAWHKIQINSLEASQHSHRIKGLATREWVESRKEEWSETSDFYRIRILGEFPISDEGALISPHDVIAAEKRWAERSSHNVDKATNPLKIGIDVARDGADSTVFTLVRGNLVIAYPHEARCETGDAVAQVVVNLKQKYCGINEVPIVNVDAIGVGAAAYDALKRVPGIKLNGVKVSEKSNRPDMFYNLRAELYWGLKTFIEGGGVIPKHAKLSHELSSIQQVLDIKGKIRIEPKEETKARIGRSPDFADSMALALYNPPKLVAPSRGVAKGIL